MNDRKLKNPKPLSSLTWTEWRNVIITGLKKYVDEKTSVNKRRAQHYQALLSAAQYEFHLNTIMVSFFLLNKEKEIYDCVMDQIKKSGKLSRPLNYFTDKLKGVYAKEAWKKWTFNVEKALEDGNSAQDLVKQLNRWHVLPEKLIMSIKVPGQKDMILEEIHFDDKISDIKEKLAARFNIPKEMQVVYFEKEKLLDDKVVSDCLNFSKELPEFPLAFSIKKNNSVIYMKVPGREPIGILIHPNSTAHEIKKIIQAKVGISAENQDVLIQGVRLSGSDKIYEYLDFQKCNVGSTEGFFSTLTELNSDFLISFEPAISKCTEALILPKVKTLFTQYPDKSTLIYNFIHNHPEYKSIFETLTQKINVEANDPKLLQEALKDLYAQYDKCDKQKIKQYLSTDPTLLSYLLEVLPRMEEVYVNWALADISPESQKVRLFKKDFDRKVEYFFNKGITEPINILNEFLEKIKDNNQLSQKVMRFALILFKDANITSAYDISRLSLIFFQLNQKYANDNLEKFTHELDVLLYTLDNPPSDIFAKKNSNNSLFNSINSFEVLSKAIEEKCFNRMKALYEETLTVKAKCKLLFT